MRKRTVGLGHPVRVLALLDGISPAIGCIEQLSRKPLGHCLFVTFARSRDDPADAERLPAGGAHFHWNLIGGPAYATRAHLDRRHDIVECLLEDRDRILLGLALDDIERAIDDAFSDRLLAGVHDGVHELRDHQVSVFRIRVDLSFVGTVAAGHRMVLWSLSRSSGLDLAGSWFCSAGSTQNDLIYLGHLLGSFTWVVLLRTWSAAVSGSSRLAYRGRRARYGSARPAGP